MHHANRDMIICFLLSTNSWQCLEASGFITSIKEHYLTVAWSPGDQLCNENKEYCKTSGSEKHFHRVIESSVWEGSSSLAMDSYAPLSSYPGKGEESYPDLLALVIAIIVTIIVAMGVKNSVGLNNVLNVINLAVWVFIMIAGLFFIKSDNWSEGQFLPFGWPGVSPVCSGTHSANTTVCSALLVVCSSCFHFTPQVLILLSPLSFGQRPPAPSLGPSLLTLPNLRDMAMLCLYLLPLLE